MKKQIFVLLVLLLVFQQANTQVNMNPDPNGEPWWSGDGVLLTAEEIAIIPVLEITTQSANTPLP